MGKMLEGNAILPSAARTFNSSLEDSEVPAMGRTGEVDFRSPALVK